MVTEQELRVTQYLNYMKMCIFTNIVGKSHIVDLDFINSRLNKLSLIAGKSSRIIIPANTFQVKMI